MYFIAACPAWDGSFRDRIASFPIRIREIPIRIKELPTGINEIRIGIKGITIRISEIPIKIWEIPIEVRGIPTGTREFSIGIREIPIGITAREARFPQPEGKRTPRGPWITLSKSGAEEKATRFRILWLDDPDKAKAEIRGYRVGPIPAPNR